MHRCRIVNCVITLSFIFGLSSANAEQNYTGQIENGKEKSATCAACHADDGNTSTPNIPKLAGQHESYLYDQLVAFKKGNAKGGRYNAIMAGIVATLNNEDMADLAAYYASLKRGTNQANPDQLARGQQLYRAGDHNKGIPACSACHGPSGAGNALGKIPALSAQNAEYTVLQLKRYKNDDSDCVMCAVASAMDDDDMKTVANYIAGLY